MAVETTDIRELASRIVDALADHFGEDILMLDIRDMTSLADYFVIASSTSERQMKALVEALLELRTLSGHKPRVEGEPESGWVLLDFGGVITHLFSGEKRRRYRLEEVWGQAHTVVRLQ